MYRSPSFGEDILTVTGGPHPEPVKTRNLTVFCNELRHSPEAEHARVTSILRYGPKGRRFHRFLILHAVKKSDQRFFIRLGRRPQTQDLVKLVRARYLAANDYVGLRIVAIPDGILTASMLHLGNVGLLECGPAIPERIPRGGRHQF